MHASTLSPVSVANPARPAATLIQDRTGVTLCLAIPGVTRRGCLVRRIGRSLMVNAVPSRHCDLPGIHHLRERHQGPWRRNFPLPSALLQAQPGIDVAHGQVTVRLPFDAGGATGIPTRPDPVAAHGFLAVDLFETSSRFIVTGDIPGSVREDVEVSLADGWLDLVVMVPQPPSDGLVVWDERPHGRFERRLRLPHACNPLWVAVEVDAGVLCVELRKYTAGFVPEHADPCAA